MSDGSNLILEVSADPMAESDNNAYMAWLVYTGDDEPSGFSARGTGLLTTFPV